jgi:hypothetical protein
LSRFGRQRSCTRRSQSRSGDFWKLPDTERDTALRNLLRDMRKKFKRQFDTRDDLIKFFRARFRKGIMFQPQGPRIRVKKILPAIPVEAGESAERTVLLVISARNGCTHHFRCTLEKLSSPLPARPKQTLEEELIDITAEAMDRLDWRKHDSLAVHAA